jgi:superfamily II DNA helicase RecQ
VDNKSHPDIPPDVLLKFRTASPKWWRLLDIADNYSAATEAVIAWDNREGDVAEQEMTVEEAMEEAVEEAVDLGSQCNITHPVRVVEQLYAHQTLGRNADFRSLEQRHALQCILTRETDLLLVLPTGGGKSLLFQAAAMLEQGLTTVVILPFVALTLRFRHSAGGLPGGQVESAVWERTAPEMSQVALLFVSVDDAVTTDFRNYLHILHSKRQLARIVYDESHVVEAQSGFRTHLRDVTKIRDPKLSVPLLLLSATVPPTQENALAWTFRGERLPVIRRRTERPNLSYQVQVHQDAMFIIPAIIAFVRSRVTDLATPGDARGIIYCPSKQRDIHRDRFSLRIVHRRQHKPRERGG